MTIATLSGQINLTRPKTPKWWFSKGNLLISRKSRLVKYYKKNPSTDQAVPNPFDVSKNRHSRSRGKGTTLSANWKTSTSPTARSLKLPHSPWRNGREVGAVGARETRFLPVDFSLAMFGIVFNSPWKASSTCPIFFGMNVSELFLHLNPSLVCHLCPTVSLSIRRVRSTLWARLLQQSGPMTSKLLIDVLVRWESPKPMSGTVPALTKDRLTRLVIFHLKRRAPTTTLANPLVSTRSYPSRWPLTSSLDRGASHCRVWMKYLPLIDSGGTNYN